MNSFPVPVGERSVKVVVIGLLDDDMEGLDSSSVRAGVGSLDDVRVGGGGGGGGVSPDDGGGGEPLVLVVDGGSSGGRNDGLDDVCRNEGGGGVCLDNVCRDGGGGGVCLDDDGGSLNYLLGVVHGSGLSEVSRSAWVVSSVLVVLIS